MDVSEKDFLQKVSPLLFDSFEPVDLLPYFLVNQLISDDDAKRIRSEKERRFRVADLLGVMTRGFPSLEPLLTALNQSGYGQLASELRYGFQSLPYGQYRGNERRYQPLEKLASIAKRDGLGRSLYLPEGEGGGRGGVPGYHRLVGAYRPRSGSQSASSSFRTEENRALAQRPPPLALGGGIGGVGSSSGFVEPPPSGVGMLSPLSGNTKRLRQFFEATLAGTPHPNDLEFLLTTTTFTERQIIDWFREFAKACPNGRLTKPQFVKFYKYIDPSEPYTERFCEHVFRVFDRDRSGFIDFKEFLIALNIKFNGSPRERLEWTFRMYDIDGNGVLDLSEMTTVTETLFDMLGRDEDFAGRDRKHAARQTAEMVFARMDISRSGKISLEQFIDGCLADPTVFSLLTTSFFTG